MLHWRSREYLNKPNCYIFKAPTALQAWVKGAVDEQVTEGPFLAFYEVWCNSCYLQPPSGLPDNWRRKWPVNTPATENKRGLSVCFSLWFCATIKKIPWTNVDTARSYVWQGWDVCLCVGGNFMQFLSHRQFICVFPTHISALLPPLVHSKTLPLTTRRSSLWSAPANMSAMVAQGLITMLTTDA